MEYADFKAVTSRLFYEYLESISDAIESGKARLGEGFLCYPSIILFSETDSVFIAELTGYKKSLGFLQPKTIKSVSIDDYFSHFSTSKDMPTIRLDGEETGFKNLILTNKKDMSTVKKRYNIDPTDRVQTVIVSEVSKFVKIECGKSFTSAYLDSCYILNQFDSNIRMRSILHSVIVDRNIEKQKYIEMTRQRFYKHRLKAAKSTDDLLIVSLRKEESSLIDERTEFINLITIREVSEPTIGAFLASNPGLLRRAFSIEGFLHEKELEWKAGNLTSKEKSIKPDFFPRRIEGRFDIMDLKKPRWEFVRLTKGSHRRRRFIDYVSEGIAQLANYEDYFNYPENRAYALNKYGITVENPNLYLIVGNYENLPTDEKIEAMRSHKQNLVIMDYETINALASI